MTGEEWLTSEDPTALLAFARRGLSPRRFRLLAVGAAALVADHASYAECRRAAEVALRLADGRAGRKEVVEARRGVERLLRTGTVNPTYYYPLLAYLDLLSPRPGRALDAVARWVRQACGASTEKDRIHMLGLVRDVVAAPPAVVRVRPEWRTDAVLGLARGVYADAAFSRLPVLADALDDAGCDCVEILQHLRGSGPHYPGCWPVDHILGLA